VGDTIGRLYSRRLSLGGNQYPDVESVEADPNGILDRRGGSFAALRGGSGVGPPTALYLCLGGTVWVTLWTSTGGFGAPGQSPVTGIQNNPVSSAAPAIGDTFIWDGAEYILAPGGGGGGSTYFGPRYVVGNVPNGDSAVAFSAGGFVYIPDPGDGSGIATACSAAGGAPGDIHIRAGTYDLNQPGSPGVQFQVPGVVVSGAGAGTIILGNNSAPAETTVFEVGNGGTLRDLLIQTTLDTGNGGGLGIVEGSGGDPVYIENVTVEYTRDATATSNIRGAFYGNFTPMTCVGCRATVSGTRSPVNPDEALASFVSRGSTMTLSGCSANGGDGGMIANGAFITTRLAANGCSATNFTSYGMVSYGATGSASLAVDGGCTISSPSGGTIGVLFLNLGSTATGSVQGSTIALDSAPASGTFGVVVNAGTQVRIGGSDITAETGVDSSAGSNDIIVANVITAQPGTQLVTAGSDEAAHNILL
jgi:hypothetical protein